MEVKKVNNAVYVTRENETTVITVTMFRYNILRYVTIDDKVVFDPENYNRSLNAEIIPTRKCVENIFNNAANTEYPYLTSEEITRVSHYLLSEPMWFYREYEGYSIQGLIYDNSMELTIHQRKGYSIPHKFGWCRFKIFDGYFDATYLYGDSHSEKKARVYHRRITSLESLNRIVLRMSNHNAGYDELSKLSHYIDVIKLRFPVKEWISR